MKKNYNNCYFSYGFDCVSNENNVFDIFGSVVQPPHIKIAEWINSNNNIKPDFTPLTPEEVQLNLTNFKLIFKNI